MSAAVSIVPNNRKGGKKTDHERLGHIGLHVKNSPHGLQQLHNRAGLSCWTVDQSHPS